MDDKVIDRVDMPATRRGLWLNTKVRFGGYLLEARAAAEAVKRSSRGGPGVEAPFVIFGRGRSGSTLLVNLLDSHPDVTCLGEILRYPVVFPHTYIANCVSHRGAKAVGFKLLSYQLKNGLDLPSGGPFLRKLVKDGYRIVYLHRENLFRHAISNLYAVKRGVYHQDKAAGAPQPKIIIRPKEMLAWMEGSEGLGVYEREALAGLDYTEIRYERDLATPDVQERTTQRLINDLGLPPAPSSAPLRKVTPEALGDFVANIDELTAAVADSRFAPFLKTA